MAHLDRQLQNRVQFIYSRNDYYSRNFKINNFNKNNFSSGPFRVFEKIFILSKWLDFTDKGPIELDFAGYDKNYSKMSQFNRKGSKSIQFKEIGPIGPDFTGLVQLGHFLIKNPSKWTKWTKLTYNFAGGIIRLTHLYYLTKIGCPKIRNSIFSGTIILILKLF